MSKTPTDFRRITLLVNDIEKPLKIYHDILGMKIYYDDEMTLTGVTIPAGELDTKARLVILQCNDPYIGMLGILQYLDPPLPEQGEYRKRLGIGDSVFVMNHDDVRTVYEQLKEIDGVHIQSEPSISEYPKPDGGVFRLLGISFFDPNGYFIEVNQWLDR